MKSLPEALVAPVNPPLIKPPSIPIASLGSACWSKAGGIVVVIYGAPLSPPPIVSRPYLKFLRFVNEACWNIPIIKV